MIQLTRVAWRLLACYNGASPECIIVVVIVVVVSETTLTYVFVHT